MYPINVFAQMKIGVALPLMNSSDSKEEKRVGEQMLRGINDALDEYNKSNPENIVEIKADDTRRDQATTLNIFNKFGSDSTVIAIFGPVFSSELVNNAGAAKFHHIPIVTPTATQSFIAVNNEYVFQLNPTYDIRGRSMAKYAMKELGMKNFVILAEDSYGKNFASGFSDEVNKNEGSIYLERYYSKDAGDFTNQLAEIKSKILEKDKFIDFGKVKKDQIDKLRTVKFLYSYIDSLIDGKTVVSIYKILGRNADLILSSIGVIPISHIDQSKEFIPGFIDAVYFPISNSGEIGTALPQYFSENINLPLLGTSDWSNEKALHENRMYIEKLIFDSDFYLPEKSGSDLENISDADIKNYYFGYDGMKLILDQIAKGNTSRDRLNKALESVTDYPATHNGITIKNRTNHQIMIMTFGDDGLKKITDYVY